MKKITLTLLTVMILATISVSQSFGMAPETIKVKVNGLVCDFCARSLEKTLNKQESIEDIDIDLTTKMLTITLKSGADLNDETIEGLVENSGYNVEKIHREE